MIRRMDYMSSEDSSEGDDLELAPGEWQRLANSARTDQNGQIMEHEKVLEVKTPRWRSDEVSMLSAHPICPQDDQSRASLVAKSLRQNRRRRSADRGRGQGQRSRSSTSAPVQTRATKAEAPAG